MLNRQWSSEPIETKVGKNRLLFRPVNAFCDDDEAKCVGEHGKASHEALVAFILVDVAQLRGVDFEVVEA